MCLYTPSSICAELGELNNEECNYIENKHIMDNMCQLAVEETNVAFDEIGCNHERNSNQDGNTFAYGFQDPSNRFRTIMAYNCNSESGCPRVQRFSSRDGEKTWNGLAIGDSLNDNARQMKEVARIVANYRQTKVPLESPTSFTVNYSTNYSTNCSSFFKTCSLSKRST